MARLLGLAPVPVPPHVFAIEAGAIRYGGFARSGGGFDLERLAEVELPPDTFHAGPLGGPLRGREAFEHALEAVLAETSPAPTEASLVLPDRWLRLLFAPLEDELGANPGDDILRFKLKKLVPFRVEDLRLRAAVVPAVAGPSGTGARLLFAFALEQVLRDLEAVFEARGVRIGQVASRSLYLMSLLRHRAGTVAAEPPGDPDADLLLVNLEPDGYCLCYLAGGAPFVVRYRALQVDPGDPGQAAHVAQDLRILLGFLEEHLPGRFGGEVLVCGAPAAATTWVELLRDRFSLAARPLGAADLPGAGAIAGVSGPPSGSTGAAWHRLAPLLAAAALEVA